MNQPIITSSKKSNSIYLIILISLIGISCKSIHSIGNTKIVNQPITIDSFQKLNGIYSNYFHTTFGKIHGFSNNQRSDSNFLTILDQLFKKYPESAWRDKNGNSIEDKNKWIKIDVISKNEAMISMYNDNEFAFSKKIHGKIKNGYFYLRPKMYIVPFFPLLYAHNFERARMGKTITNDLIINFNFSSLGFCPMGGGAERGATSSIYRQKGR